MVIYELFDSYLNLRKNTTLYSKKQLLGFKKDCTDISPHRFSKLSERDATHFGARAYSSPTGTPLSSVSMKRRSAGTRRRTASWNFSPNER